MSLKVLEQLILNLRLEDIEAAKHYAKVIRNSLYTDLEKNYEDTEARRKLEIVLCASVYVLVEEMDNLISMRSLDGIGGEWKPDSFVNALLYRIGSLIQARHPVDLLKLRVHQNKPLIRKKD